MQLIELSLQVNRVLPDWLANRTAISSNLKADHVPLENVPLDMRFNTLLRNEKIESFFPGLLNAA
jgi:hypothetical protein